MGVGKIALAALLPLAIAGGSCLADEGHTHPAARDQPGDFDYYKMTYSREREWCVAKGTKPAKCMEKSREYVVHGLWPQNDSGYPRDCEIEDSANQANETIEKQIAEVIPKQIINHEWKMHGTCSGFNRGDYFREVVRLHTALKMPSLERGSYTVAAIKKAVADVNPGLTSKNIQISCRENGGFTKANAKTLDEIRVCYAKDLNGFVPCVGQSDLCPSDLTVRY